MKRDALDNPEFRELYMKYLGTLQVLGSLATYADEDSREEREEELDAVFNDASNYLQGSVKLIRRSTGWYLLPEAE